MSEDAEPCHIAKSLAALGALTQDILRDVTTEAFKESEAFAVLTEEVDNAVSRLSDGYMALKLRSALSSTQDDAMIKCGGVAAAADELLALSTGPAVGNDKTQAVITPEEVSSQGDASLAPGSSLEQILFPGSDNSLLDDVLAQTTEGALNMMDSQPSPLDELACDAPLVPDRSYSAMSDDLLNGHELFSSDLFSSDESVITVESVPPTAEQPASDADAVPSTERLRSWHEEGGTNLRALLASLHTVAPAGSTNSWEKTSLADLVSDATVKRAYQRSLLAVHPDKLPPTAREAGQQIFDTLRDAWGAHKARS